MEKISRTQLEALSKNGASVTRITQKQPEPTKHEPQLSELIEKLDKSAMNRLEAINKSTEIAASLNAMQVESALVLLQKQIDAQNELLSKILVIMNKPKPSYRHEIVRDENGNLKGVVMHPVDGVQK